MSHPLIVMKFGGTSVADIDRIRNVARHVKREVDAGHEVAVVVSAMSGKTNELVGWVESTSPLYDAREYDAVVSSGENVTAGLMALTLATLVLLGFIITLSITPSPIFLPLLSTSQTSAPSSTKYSTGRKS